jgi:hypothetical protein
VQVAGSVDFKRPADQVWAYVAGVSQMRPSLPGPAQAGVTTHEALRPLEPLVVWLLRRQTTADLRRLKQLLEASANRPAPS